MLDAQLARGDDVVVIDVRGADEFTGQLGHIAGARNIAVDDLAGRLDELADLKSRDVTLVCRTDKRSAAAADVLKSAGFRSVSVLRGGMVEWNRQDLPRDPHQS